MLKACVKIRKMSQDLKSQESRFNFSSHSVLRCITNIENCYLYSSTKTMKKFKYPDNPISQKEKSAILYHFWLNILIPCCGIIFFHWTPGSVLFYFFIELINYWLCNTVLLLFYVSEEDKKVRMMNVLKFSFYFIISLVGFYFFIVFLVDAKDSSMDTNVTYGQIITVTILYWLQFAFYLYKEKPKGKVTMAAINKEVSNRMTGIYFTIFCVVLYVFSFWSNTKVMNFAIAFVMIFAKSLTDLVIIVMKMSGEKK